MTAPERQPAPEPSPEEQAVIDRFGIFAEEEAKPYPCYCPSGLAGCDEPYAHCDRAKELRDSISDAAREWVYSHTHDELPHTPGEFADRIMPLIERACWERAAAELRLAASDAEESGRVYIYELTSWLRDRAGVMDGGAR